MGRPTMETALGVCALLAVALTQLAAGKIISCGGFIKSSVPGIDLSSVRVKLFTAQENLKYETECNPSTGYYMIPIYTKGKYRLQVVGPEGWIFEPDSQALEIVADDDDGPCANDINFQLYGFTITGKVTDTSGVGQADLSIALRSKSGDSVDTIVTQADGVYKFKAPPGSYILSIPNLSSGVQCIDRGSVSVEVTKSPVSVKTDIHITGQTLAVTVRDETEVVVSGAIVNLVSSRKLNFNNAAKEGKPKETKEGPTSWVYSAHSNVDGVALFPCIPGGEYTIRGEWSSSDAKLNFALKKVSTTGRSATSITLTAESFDAISKLLTPTSRSGIGEAEILIDGQRAATTDSGGRYVLKGLTAKTYRLGVTKPQYEFASLDWDASSSVPVPRLGITALSVCGKVEFGEKKGGHVRLRISNEGGKLIDSIDVGAESGEKFCRMLPPGKYRLEPEQSHGQTFAPTVLAVDLRDSPYLNAKFTQFQASIAGRVAIMEDAGGVGLKLKLLSGEELLQEIKTTKEGTFQFDGVSPGSYKVRVVEDDGATLWWERAEQQVEIVDRSVSDLVFRHSGYRAKIDSTTAVHLKYSFASITKRTELKVGNNNDVFFPAKGQWKLEVVDSCHDFFTTADESLLRVPTKSTFQLIAKSSQLLVSIATESPVTQPKFGITIQGLDAGDVEEKIVLDEATKAVGKTSFTFAFHMKQASTGHRFAITPKSSEYLFSPTSLSFTFDGECGKIVANFKATIGKFIEGNVSPPVVGARVIARRKTGGESELEPQGETDERGRYRLGPVWDTTGFVIDISKEGYEFERSSSASPTRFKAVRLSQLRLNLRDEDGGKPLAEVLISLSGPNNYRSNVVVDKTGSFSFIGLAPGEYFVRPILLEYRFSSISTSVVIREGEVQELELGAKRIAYSAFGRFTTLDGQRVPASVRVEAISTQCENHQEEDDFDGSKTSEFRIRGLKPECLYRVQVKEVKSGEEEKASEATTWSVYPPYANVQADQIKDWNGITFVLTPAIANRYTVMGRVLFERIPPSGIPSSSTTYAVELYRVGESVPLREVQLTSPGSAFVMPDVELVENESYSVGIRKSDAVKLKIQPLTSVFTANSSVIYIKLRAEKEKRSAELDSSKSSYLGFVVVILITVAFFSKQETLRSTAGRTADGVRTLLERLRKRNAASEHERRLKRTKKNG